MRLTKRHLKTVLIVCAAFTTILFNGCKKAKVVTEIDFYNNSYTPVNITVNGSSAVIAAGDFVAFTGDAGSAVSGNASTANYSSSGTRIGELITWTISDNFPGSG